MKRLILIFVAIALLASGSLSAYTQALLKVCGNPVSPCKSKHKEFAPYELSMVIPVRIKPNTEYKSEPFFAVMLKEKIAVPANEECDGGEFHTKVEAERKKVQSLFLSAKVFAGYQCPDMGAIGYSIGGQPYNENFMAVYGGTTMEDANQVLLLARTRYPKATIKKMQAVFEHISQ
jgi:hypothetical protein